MLMRFAVGCSGCRALHCPHLYEYLVKYGQEVDLNGAHVVNLCTWNIRMWIFIAISLFVFLWFMMEFWYIIWIGGTLYLKDCEYIFMNHNCRKCVSVQSSVTCSILYENRCVYITAVVLLRSFFKHTVKDKIFRWPEILMMVISIFYNRQRL